MKDCYIFDVEGTLSNHNHRLKFVPSDKTRTSNWEKFQSLFHMDKPNASIIQICEQLHQDYHIMISTGMPWHMKEDLNIWLYRNIPSVRFTEILMREPEDIVNELSSPDLKRNHVARLRSIGWNPVCAFDDRLDVCEMFDSQGVESFHLPFKGWG